MTHHTKTYYRVRAAVRATFWLTVGIAGVIALTIAANIAWVLAA